MDGLLIVWDDWVERYVGGDVASPPFLGCAQLIWGVVHQYNMGMSVTASATVPVTLSPVVPDASVGELLGAAAGLLQAAYARVSGDYAGLSEEDLMGDIVAAQRVQNSAWAIQSHRLTQAAAIEHRDDPNPIQGALPRLIHRVVRHDPGSFVDEWFALETGTRLGWSDRQSNTRLGEALDTVERCPRLVDRVGSGGLLSVWLSP